MKPWLVAAVGSSVLCLPPPLGMVAWYPGDDNTPSDLLGQHDGAFVGFPVSPVDWKVGGGALAFFPSPSTYVVVPGGSTGAGSLNFGTDDFSIDMWVKPSIFVSGVTTLLDKRTASPLQGYSLYLFNGNLGFQLADGVNTNYNSSLPVPADGNWHFIAATVDRDNASGLVLYVDGQSQSFNPTGRQGSLDNNADLLIGARSPSLGGGYFRGLMDEIEFFNRALTSTEIIDIFHADSAGKCKCQPLSDGSDCTNVGCECFGECVGGGYCDDPSCCLVPGECLCYSPNSQESIKLCGDCFGECAGPNYCDDPTDPSSCWTGGGGPVCWIENHPISIYLCGNCFGECIDGGYCDHPNPDCCIAGQDNCLCYDATHPISVKMCGTQVKDCHPTCVNYDLATQITLVTDCDCGGANECHVIVPEPGTGPPKCVDDCPAGEICEQTETNNAEGTIDICCRCEPAAVCESLPDGPCCTDGDVCTSGDACNSGFCVGNYVPNCCHTSPECNDYNACTTDACVGNACTHGNVTAGTPCGSAIDDACTNPDTCGATGNCMPNNAVDGTACVLAAGASLCRSGLCGQPTYRAIRLPEGGGIDGSEAQGGTFRQSNEKILILGGVNKAGRKQAAVWECGTRGQVCALTELPDGGAISSEANDVDCNPAGKCMIVGSRGDPVQPAAWQKVGNNPWTAESVPLPPGKLEGELRKVKWVVGPEVLSRFMAAGTARELISPPANQSSGMFEGGVATANLNSSKSNINRKQEPNGPWTASDLPDFGIDNRESMATFVAVCPAGAAGPLCNAGEVVIAGWAAKTFDKASPILYRESGIGTAVFNIFEVPLPVGFRAARRDDSASVFLAVDAYTFGGNVVGPLFTSNLNLSKSNINAATAAVPVNYDLALTPLPGYDSSLGNSLSKAIDKRDKKEKLGLSYNSGEDPLASGVPTQWTVDYTGPTPTVLAAINMRDIVSSEDGSTLLAISDLEVPANKDIKVGTIMDSSFAAAGGTPQPHAVILIPQLLGDCDVNDRVDALDVAHIQNCYTDADGGPTSPSCACDDLDGDGDIDQDDWRVFVTGITGP